MERPEQQQALCLDGAIRHQKRPSRANPKPIVAGFSESAQAEDRTGGKIAVDKRPILSDTQRIAAAKKRMTSSA